MAHRRRGRKGVTLICLVAGVFFFAAESAVIAASQEPDIDETFVSVTLKIDPYSITKGDTFYEAIDVCGEKARPVEVVGPVAEGSDSPCIEITGACPIKILQIQNLQLLEPDLKFQLTYDPSGDWNNNEPPKGDFKFFARCLPIFSEDIINIDAEVVSQSNKKTVFVTSETYTGNLGGLHGANVKCNTLAQEAGLLGTFKAWVSMHNKSGLNPYPSSDEEWTYSTFPYARVDGVIVADDFNDLYDCAPDCLKARINVDENRNTIANHPFLAWTGGPLLGKSCDSWWSEEERSRNNLYSVKGVTGSITSTDRKWYDTGGYQSCTKQAHLYCFQQ